MNTNAEMTTAQRNAVESLNEDWSFVGMHEEYVVIQKGFFGKRLYLDESGKSWEIEDI